MAEEQGLICGVCSQPIEADLVLFSGIPYHEQCVKCMIKGCNFTGCKEDYTQVTPGLFFCPLHYNEYLIHKTLPSVYKQKNMENFTNTLFQPDTEDSIQVNKPYEAFLPTIELHFSKSVDEVDFDQLRELLGDDAYIIQIKRGSIILKLVLIKEAISSGITNFFQKATIQVQKALQTLKSKFTGTLGQTIIGNLEGEPKITLPSPTKIKELYNSPSINLLQNNEELNSIDLDEVLQKVIEEAKKDNKNSLNRFIFVEKEKDVFEKAERQIREDILRNDFDMVIVNETLIANKYNDQYQQIKGQIDSNSIEERFLYHGSLINNHYGIINEGFFISGKSNSNKPKYGALFGFGVYATSNLFYASHYANDGKTLKFNQTAPVLYCKVIYNKNKVVEMKYPYKWTYRCKPIPNEVKNNYGIHHALIGMKSKYHPFDMSQIDNQYYTAEEFVFPNKFQVIPIFSFTVMRTSHLILWKDENLDNSENSRYMKELSEKMQVNVYSRKSLEESMEVVRLKRKNVIKLITNGGANLSGKKLIEEARKVIGSDFVCLVFAMSWGHFEWVKNMKNVLLTNKAEMFRKFAALNMEINSIMGFIDELEKLHKVKYYIDQNQLLNFPNIID